ncbi:MAG TPA: glycosyltransferase [Pyrinomonadaceae bacterium]|nr:glycosyltransferase [Pyrinomonadaceae bacterium]
MINAFCFYYGNDSWSRGGRYFFDAWQRQEEVRIISWDKPADDSLHREPVMPSADHPGVGLGPVERMAGVVGSPRVGFVVWETTIIPPEKLNVLRSLDAIWTTSRWGRQLLLNNGIGAEKISVVPKGVDVERFKPGPGKDHSLRRFRFLFVGKWEIRKGVEDLLQAFADEFHVDEPVELVIHGSNPYLRGFDLERNIRHVLGSRVASVIASRPLAEEGMVRLYNSCDAFVLPTRGEGWGLPIMEAMACGLPVIVTEYSAPREYLSQETAYLIGVEKLIPVCDPIFFRAGTAYGEWAQPDLGHLRKLMRHVFENQAEAREKGQAGRADVCCRWTWDHAVTTARSVLKAVS